MFCRNCGKELADGAKFCDGCGAPTDAAGGGYAPVAPAQPAQNPMVTNFTASLTGIVKDPEGTVRKEARSGTLEWAIFAGISLVTFALSMAIGFKKVLAAALSIMTGSTASLPLSFGGMLGMSFLVGLIAFGLLTAGVWVAANYVFKTQVSFPQALNMVGVASLPFSAACIVNMLAGLLWGPLAVVFFGVGAAMSAVLLYEGFKEYAGEKSPFLMFLAVVGVTVLLTVIIAYFLFQVVGKSSLENAVMEGLGNAFGNALGGLADLF